MSESSGEATNRESESPERKQLEATIRNLEVENRELKQEIFDHYEWSRQQQKKVITELECLRSISIAYRILDFFRRQIERSTGASRNALEVETEKTKVSLVLAPQGSVQHVRHQLHECSEQDHKLFEVILVANDVDPIFLEDSPMPEDLKIVKVPPEKVTSARVRLGFGQASGEILGYLDEQSSLLSSALRSVAFFFQRNPTIQVTHVPTLCGTSSGWVLCETPARIDFISAWERSTPSLSNFFFRRKAFEIVHGVDTRIEEAWEYATILRLLRLYPSRLNPAAVRLCLSDIAENLSGSSSMEAARQRVRELLQKDFWKTEWIRQGLSHEISQLRAKAFHRLGPKLWFPSPTGSSPGNSGKHQTLPQLPRCPVTEQQVDRFLFTLVGTGKTEPESYGVFLHTASQVAAITQFTGKSELPSAGDVLSIGQSRARGADDWTFARLSGLGIEEALKRIPPTSVRSQDLKVRTAEQAYAGQLALAAHKLSEFPRRILDFPSHLPWAVSWKKGVPDSTAEIVVAEGWEIWLKTADFGGFIQTVFGEIKLGDDERLFDAIHLPALIQTSGRPRYLLRILANLLRWNGLLVITTPNLDSAQLNLFGPAWCHWDPSQNAFVFSVHALRELMRHCGFQEVVMKTFSNPDWTMASLGRFLAATEREGKAEALSSEIHKSSRQQSLAVEICAQAEKPLLGDCILGVFSKVY